MNSKESCKRYIVPIYKSLKTEIKYAYRLFTKRMISDMLTNTHQEKVKKIGRRGTSTSTTARFVFDTSITFSSLTVVKITFVACASDGRRRRPRKTRTTRLCAAIVTQTPSSSMMLMSQIQLRSSTTLIHLSNA